MHKSTAFAFAAAVVLLAQGCATAPRPAESTSVDHGLLILSGQVRAAVFRFIRDPIDGGVVVQLDENKEPIPGRVITSKRGDDGVVFFSDLPAGTYTLSGISFISRGVRTAITLPEDQARARAVELHAGETGFLGEIELRSSVPSFFDGVVRIGGMIYRLLTPLGYHAPLPRDAAVWTWDQEPEAETNALERARPLAAGTSWSEPIRKRIEQLGVFKPATHRTAIGLKVLPPHREDLLIWRDTLEWGDPKHFPDGLLWSKSGSSARIAVFFTSSTATGFRGYDAALAELREKSKSQMDGADVYEVLVGTRAAKAARLMDFRYPEKTLLGSERVVVVTETVIIPADSGMYTVRFRADAADFRKAQREFRTFLSQLQLLPPNAPKQELQLE